MAYKTQFIPGADPANGGSGATELVWVDDPLTPAPWATPSNLANIANTQQMTPESYGLTSEQLRKQFPTMTPEAFQRQLAGYNYDPATGRYSGNGIEYGAEKSPFQFIGDNLVAAASLGVGAAGLGLWGPGAAGGGGTGLTTATANAPADMFGGWSAGEGTGGSMFDIYDPTTWGADWGGSAANSAGYDLSALGQPTNLQDMITALDKTSAGSSSLNQIMANAGFPGGASDVASALASKVGPQAAKSLLEQAFSDPSGKTIASLLAGLAPGALAAYGANQQQDSLQAIADKARADRAPFLDQAKAWMTGGPEAWAAGPGAGALKGVLHGLSARFGNPIGSGTALQIATDSAANNWLNQTSQLANLGLGGNTAALDTNAVNAGGGVYTGLADALGRTLTPQSDLSSLLKQLSGSGLA